MKKTGNYCMCSFGVLITNGKKYLSTEQTVLSHCTSWTVYGFSHALINFHQHRCHCQTAAPLSHSISSFPDPPPFLPSICVHNYTRKWSSAPVYSCTWMQMEDKNGGGLGMRLVTHYIQAFVFVLCCFSILSLLFMNRYLCFNLDYTSWPFVW